jgi:hypothetical protein
MTESSAEIAAARSRSEVELRVGLFGQLAEDPEMALPPPDELLPNLGDGLVLSLLRSAVRHPLVGDEFTLLLLERLRGVAIDASPVEQGPGEWCCVLSLQLVGTGIVATVLERHLADLRALISGVLNNKSVFSRCWDSSDSGWVWAKRHYLRTVELRGPGDQTAWLSWPGLVVVGGGVASVAGHDAVVGAATAA